MVAALARGALTLARLPLVERRLGYLAGLANVAVVSVLIGLVLGRAQIANISMLYLTAILLTAIAFGRGPAVVASVAAFLTFDFLFVEPVHTFTVSDPEEWIALLLFLVTGLVTGHLAAALRQRAHEAEERKREAERREREAIVLYDVVRLLGEPELGPALRAVAERLQRELGLAAVRIELTDPGSGDQRVGIGDPEALELSRAAASKPARVLAGGPPPSGDERGGPGRWRRVVPPRPSTWRPSDAGGRLHVVPVAVAGRRIGALALVRWPNEEAFAPADDRLLSAVAAQLGQAVERGRLRREATEAEILRRTDELKSALMNAVSHDVRTPLASIIAGAGSLRQKDVAWSEEDRDEFAAAIEEEAHRLNRIFGNLLDLTRMEAGTLRPDKGWHDVGALVDGVVGRLRPVTARHRVVVDVPEELPPILLDAVEIDQVLSNLLENATKYTPPGTEILVRAGVRDRELRLEVADRGPGIPLPALKRLFEAFYRVDGQRAPSTSKGLGLGLAIVRGLVEAHGGRVWAENRAGGGARFVVALPLGDAPAPPADDARA